MELWSQLVYSYPEHPGARDFAKALRTIDTLISKDLAPFEIEWLVKTVLFKPIDVLNSIATKRSEDWFKNIADAFKILSKLVCKYWYAVEKDHEIIIKLCELPYDAQTKKAAIHCLTNILKKPGVDAGNTKYHIDALQTSATCKAPLAVLVGTICRYYPEGIDQEYIRVWRIYLNMLQQQNITDTIVNAVLQGIDGLFEKFGRDLPIMELDNFYKDLSRKCASMSKCIDPLLSILKSHADLFREKLTEDNVLRLYLWGLNHPLVKDALLSVYTVIFQNVTEDKMQSIINDEIRPKMNSGSSLVKLTALRIGFYAKKQFGFAVPHLFRPDALEFNLRHRSISHHEADLVSIALSSDEDYVKSMLETVIKYYDKLPYSVRQEIVVKGILDATEDNKKMAVTLLIELCKQKGGLEKFTSLLMALLDPETENNVLEHVLKQIYNNFLEVSMTDPDELLSLSGVLAIVVCVSETERISKLSSLIDPVVHEVSILLSVKPSSLFSSKIILSNPNFDTKLLIKALSDYDMFLKSTKYSNYPFVSEIIKDVLKLRAKRHISTTDDRILARDLSIFVAEHRTIIPKENYFDNLYSLEVKNKIFLTLQNVVEGKKYKIDLQRILQLSILNEDYEALYYILTIVTANLIDRPEPSLQNVTWRVIHAMLRSNDVIDVTSALRLCATRACVQQALHSITDEMNPCVRRMLCECLEVILLCDPGSENNEELLRMVTEQLLQMMNSPADTSYEAALDITRVILNPLKEYDNFCIQYLPEFLILMSKKTLQESFKMATDLFIEKIHIFGDTKSFLEKIVKLMLNNNNNNEKDLECIFEFLKKIFEIQKYDGSFLLELIKSVCVDGDMQNVLFKDIESTKLINIFLIMALAKNHFDVEVINIINKDLVNRIMATLSEDISVATQQNICKFLNEYSVVFIQVDKEKTLKCLTILIQNLQPSTIPVIKNDLSACLRTYKTAFQGLPDEIKISYEKFCEKIDIRSITVELNEIVRNADIFGSVKVSEENCEKIQSLSDIADFFDVPLLRAMDWLNILMKSDIKINENVATNLLKISEKFLTKNQFEKIFYENEDFVMKYLNVYFVRVLFSDKVLTNTRVFVDVLKYFVANYKMYENYYDRLLSVVQEIWPLFDKLDFDIKFMVASDLIRVHKKGVITPPLKWMISVITSPDVRLDHKLKMIRVLPGGDEFSLCYRCVAGTLPVCVSELSVEHAGVLRSLLDALASSGDLTLLDIIITLADADETKGWWDDAMDVCMTALAERKDEVIYDFAYNAIKKRPGIGACRRVLLPLLRHCTKKFCEEYASKIVSDLIMTLKMGYKEPTNSELYRKRILSYAKAFSILKVIIEKVPSKNLESGIINEKVGSNAPWFFVKEVCICSMTVRDKIRCPENASAALKEASLCLQTCAYNCLVTAICNRKPSQKQYEAVFSISAWSNIVDPEVEYDFTPKGYLVDNNPRRRQDNREGPASNATSTLTYTGTVRTRLFMGTLSENPLQYDMIPNEDVDENEDKKENKPASYENHPLNYYGCLVSIVELLEHASGLEHTDWLTIVRDGLNSNVPVNAKWTLAQAICIAEVDLKPHASVLAPALLQLIAETPKIIDDRKVLNNLHIDVLWTIIKWEIKNPNARNNVTLCINYLISTCIEHRTVDSVSRRLLSTLHKLLSMYSKDIAVDFSELQKHIQEMPKTAFYLYPILQVILKNGIIIPNLLDSFLGKFDVNNWVAPSKLPELFGLALSLERHKDEYLLKFWPILENVKSIKISAYVRILKYTQRFEPRCCNEQHFRMITDLASKVERANCLAIISTYLENCSNNLSCAELFETIGIEQLLDGDNQLMVEAMKVVQSGLKFMNNAMKENIINSVIINCRNNSVGVRKQALAVISKLFQELFKINDDGDSAKRKALQSTPILDTIDSPTGLKGVVLKEMCHGFFDLDEEISNTIKDGLEVCLSKDMVVRFAELFYIVFYMNRKSDLDFSTCGYVFTDLLLREIQKQDGYKEVKLCEDGKKLGQTQTGIARQINLEIRVAEIFDVFLQSSKVYPQFCQELCLKLMKTIHIQHLGPRFALDSVMTKLIANVLKEDESFLTPFLLEASRIFLDSEEFINGLKGSLNIMKQNILNSEIKSYYKVFFEDINLRSKEGDFFTFSFDDNTYDFEMRNENQDFTIEGLINSFGYLSNWDDLNIIEKERIDSLLPHIMIEEEKFQNCLKTYFDGRENNLDYKLWFNKMAACYMSKKFGRTILQYKQNWLKDFDRWPKRDFDISAVMECLKWPEEDSLAGCYIKPTDCLVEWAARLMIRSSYYSGDEINSKICRDDELRWCREANRRQLPRLALQCIERNKGCLLEEESLPWFCENVKSRRLLALSNKDMEKLQKALEATEKADNNQSLEIKRLIIQLGRDLGVPIKKLDDILVSVDDIKLEGNDSLSNENGEILRSIYDVAMEHYNELFDNSDIATQDHIILNMATILRKLFERNLITDSNLKISILLQRLNNFDGILREHTSKTVLDQIMLMLPSLDAYSIQLLKQVCNAFPTKIWNLYKIDSHEHLDDCKEYLQLVCDPSYTLAMYCSQLLKDWSHFETLSARIAKKFTSEHGGTEYKTLTTYIEKLFSLKNVETGEREKQLKVLTTELSKKLRKPVLRLSQLSPKLGDVNILKEQRDNLRKLLNLPQNLHVVKFIEQVQVFDSLRRPCVITTLLSNGLMKKYIIKSGEELANDAATLRSFNLLSRLFEGQIRSYNVTTLSEDCAIIEYLNNYQRLQDFIGDKIKIPLERLDNDKLIYSRTLALQEYNSLCKRIPPYTLRSAIEDRCASLEEFMAKKRMFLETLSAMTITNWLFGIGDRHLQNIMINNDDCGLCSVDLASVFEYGLREFVPARLTANILAVCDLKVLESRLQCMLVCLRQSRKLYEAFVRVSFYWKGNDFNEIKYMQNILEGKMLSHQVTRAVIETSNLKDKLEYINLLDSVFENTAQKQTYSVEEQVSYLLKHCTDPRILSIIQRGWEPWV